MGTKKHKAEHEHRSKRRRRSPSSSPPGSPMPQARSRSRSPLDTWRRKDRATAADEPSSGAVAAGDSSLSVEETNRLRAKLGLKPLESNDAGNEDGNAAVVGQPQPDVHVPAKNLGAERAAEAVRARIEVVKAQRCVASKLGKVRTLGESDDSEQEDGVSGAASWVQRSRQLTEEKKKAELRAKMLAEMDEDFGISDVIRSERERERNQSYDSRHLGGLNVEHSVDRFKEGCDMVLVVKDRGVLDGDADEADTLINTNLVDDERAEKNVTLKKQGIDYKAYDDEEWDEKGNIKPRGVLNKYNETIDGEKKTSFKLVAGGKYVGGGETDSAAALSRSEEQRAASPTLRVASEFFTEQEMEERFKKRKRKVRVVRKKLRADDLLADAPMDVAAVDGTLSSLCDESKSQSDALKQNAALPEPEEEDLVGPSEDLTGVAVEPDDASEELQRALNKALKARRGARSNPQQAAGELLRSRGMEDRSIVNEPGGAIITLNRTAEFCRSLGDIPTYGQSGNRVEQATDELAEFEAELEEERRRREEASAASGGWQEVGGSSFDHASRSMNATESSKMGGASAILDDEPVLNKGGVAAALAMASRKGYLEQKSGPEPGTQIVSALRAKHVVQEDIRYDDIDSKFNKRDRFSGPLTEFREKSGYRPDVRLEYVDHCGREINEKEAFSGKKKTEKREKRIKEQMLLRGMSSSDTPLGTADKLHRKLERQGQAYVVLSGKGRDGTVL